MTEVPIIWKFTCITNIKFTNIKFISSENIRKPQVVVGRFQGEGEGEVGGD